MNSMQPSLSSLNSEISAGIDPRWVAILTRDPTADGKFVYGVKTTGIYCRPSTPSKLPKRKNVEFFDSADQAEAAGYRPSKRASDQIMIAEQHVWVINTARRIIENSDSIPAISDLARVVNLSPFYFHRIFKNATGVTPRDFALALKAQRMQKIEVQRISEIVSASTANATQKRRMHTQTEMPSKAGELNTIGSNAKLNFAVSNCTLGSILVAWGPRGIRAILLGDDPNSLVDDLRVKFPGDEQMQAEMDMAEPIKKIIEFIDEPGASLALKLDTRGTVFQEKVWRALRAIPAGTTISYAEIAVKIGAPRAIRAVVQACEANPVAVAIPCHRVVRKDGELARYPWGVERKRHLINREADARSEKPNCSSGCPYLRFGIKP